MLARRLSSRQRSRLKRVAAAILLLVALSCWKFGGAGAGDGLNICLVGNSQTAEGAKRVYKQWGGAFHSTFYCWGETGGLKSAEGGRLHFLKPRGDEAPLAFSDGMWAAVQHITSRKRCDYIFSEPSPCLACLARR